MKKRDVFLLILADHPMTPAQPSGYGQAPANIALCKYWGKRHEALNLPVTSSLSVSLGNLGTRTRVTPQPERDAIFLNGKPVPVRSSFAKGVSTYLDHFRPPGMFFKVETENDIPTAAGLASSASGFAALILALDDLFRWKLERKHLSILARLGSGSACRSVYEGFVEWHAGADEDGMDSFAEPLPEGWPALRLGLLTVSDQEKSVSSREAMKRTRRTSALYDAWPVKVSHDIQMIRESIMSRDFPLLGQVAESNALTMHATSLGAWPPVLFWLPESVRLMHQIWALRESGLQVYFTMDAGPNVKLLFLAQDEAEIRKAFPGVRIVAPFKEESGPVFPNLPSRGNSDDTVVLIQPDDDRG